MRWIAMRRPLAAALLFACALGPAAGQERPAAVQVDAVRTEPLSQTVPIIGRLVATQSGEIAARVAGAVQALDVEVGQRVAEGDVIALVDEDRLLAQAELASARVQGAEAQIEAERGELALAQQERDRLERLRNSAAFSPAALADKEQLIQVAMAGLAGAEARHSEALAELALAGQDLRDARVIAPFPGVISQKYVNVGGYVQAGDPVVALIDDASLEIEADVPSAQARALEPGAEVQGFLDGGEAITARLRAAIPDENPLTRTLALRFTIAPGDLDRLLASGETVTVAIPVGVVRDVVTVAKDAVLRRAQGDIVYVAEDGMAKMRPVSLGGAVADRFVVESGLEPGDLVVVRGNERLRPEQPIAYEPPATTAQPKAEASAS